MRKLWIGSIGVLAVGGGVLLAARPGVQQASAATATPAATAVLRVDGSTG